MYEWKGRYNLGMYGHKFVAEKQLEDLLNFWMNVDNFLPSMASCLGIFVI